jgi:hypothetical protein
MRPHDEPVARPLSPADQAAHAARQHAGRQLTATCAGLAIVVLLWAFGSRLYHWNPDPGASSHATTAKLWDNHQDLVRAVAAILPAPSRRPPNSPTRVAVPCTAIRLATAGYRLVEARRPITLAPHLLQVHLRAPPSVLA